MNPLPAAWIDSLFARLTVRYGAAWLNVWNGVDIAAVKTDWATELGGLPPEAIKYALVNLPLDRPPTLGQFKMLCVNRPEPATPTLSAPKASKARVEAALAKLQPLKSRERVKPLAWAHELQEREKAGLPLTEWQRKAWREAIRVTPLEKTGMSSDIRMIPDESLPPGMRAGSPR